MSNLVTKRVLINLDRCIECGSCGAACYYSHAGMPAVQSARQGPALLPVICRQCKAPSCLDACPVSAMKRDDNGVIRRALFMCIGCGSCARACPFGVLPNEPTKRQMAKCDLCCDRTASSSTGVSPVAPGESTGGTPVLPEKETVPRCVAACPAGALLWEDEHEAIKDKVMVIGGRSTGQHPFKRR